MSQGISIIIACYNSEKVISTTLEHLQNQKNYEGINWEVIVIDNNSTDNTSVVVQENWNRNPIVPLHIIKENKIGEANARKAGIKAAKYDILSIVDDDNWVSPDWIQKVNSYFGNPEIGLIGCAGDGVFEEKPPNWFEENQHAFAIGSLYEGTFIDITHQGLVPGAGLSIRKIIYDRLFSIGWQPFLAGRVGSKQSAGADSEMCLVTRLLGYKIYYSNELKFQHFTAKHRITWDRLKNMTEGFGESDVFTLPYTIIFNEVIGNKSILNSMRKFWWFNFIGKKIALFISDPFPFKRISEFDRKNLIRIRNNAFCKTIWNERKKFSQSFKKLKSILK